MVLRFTLAMLIALVPVSAEVVVKTAETAVPVGYIVELPEGYDSTLSYPMIVAIHGYGDRMESYVSSNRQLLSLHVEQSHVRFWMTHR